MMMHPSITHDGCMAVGIMDLNQYLEKMNTTTRLILIRVNEVSENHSKLVLTLVKMTKSSSTFTKKVQLHLFFSQSWTNFG